MTRSPEDLEKSRHRKEAVYRARKEKEEPLTSQEARIVTGMTAPQIHAFLKKHPDMREFIKIIPRQPHLSPDTLIPKIEKAVADIIADHQTPTNDLVANKIGMTKKQFEVWARNHLPDPAELGILFPRERSRVLVLSIGKIFQDLGLKFEPMSIANILQREKHQVISYLKRHRDICEELKRMGMEWSEDIS